MAITQTNRALTSYSADIGTGLAIARVSNWQDVMTRRDTPLTSLVGSTSPDANPVATNTWGWSSVTPFEDVPGNTVAIADAVSTSVTVTDADQYQVSHLFRIENEAMYVSAINTTTNVLTVVRGFAGTTAAAHTINKPITIYGIATIQNQDTPLSPVAQGETDFNYWQKFEFGVQFSFEADKIATYESQGLGKKGRFQMELVKKLKREAPQLFERSLIDGRRALGSTTSPSAMGGMYQPEYIYTRVDLGGAVLTQTLVNNVMQTAWKLVGESGMGKTMILPPFAARVLGSAYNAQRQYAANDKSVTNYVNKVNGWFGEINLMPHYLVDDVKHGILICNPKDYKVKAMTTDGEWAIYELPENGMYERGAVRAVLSLDAPSPQSRMLITNYNITPASYPNLT